MPKIITKLTVISIVLLVAGCASSSRAGKTTNEVVRQERCNEGDHQWCMQMAQTLPLGTAATGPDMIKNPPENPEMNPDRTTPYPRNPALGLVTPGVNFTPNALGIVR